jgi:hypothetical protein
MARAIKYRLQFKSLNGTGCLVNVYVDGASSSADTSKTGIDVPFSVESGVTALTGSANPLTFSETDSDNLLDVVRLKTGYLNVIEENPGDLDALRPTNSTDRYIEVFYGGDLVFFGYLQDQSFDTVIENGVREISIPITSPIGVIKGLYFGPIKSAGTTTIGDLLSEIFAALGYTWYILPKNILQSNADPASLKIGNRIISPYNPSYNYGANDLFQPISYLNVIEGICNLFGCITHDGVYLGSKAIFFTRFDYSGDYKAYDVWGETDTHTPTQVALLSNYSMADDDAKISTILPLDELDIENGEYIDNVEMNLDLATLGSSPSGREGSITGIDGKVAFFLPVSVADGGGFSSNLWSNSTAHFTTQASQGNMVRVFGTGSQAMIDLSFRQPQAIEDNTVLWQYTFSEWPREKFLIKMTTRDHTYSYRCKVMCDGKYLSKASITGTLSWVSSETYIDLTADDDGNYMIGEADSMFDYIPAVTAPVTFQLIPRGYGPSYWNDPITGLHLISAVNGLAKYLGTRTEPTRIIRQQARRNTDTITMLVSDFVDTPNRIIGGHLTAQPDYAYMFRPVKKIDMLLKEINTVRDDDEYMDTFSITGYGSGWRQVAVGFDLRNDNYRFTLMK